MQKILLTFLLLLILSAIAFTWLSYSKPGEKLLALPVQTVKKNYNLPSEGIKEIKIKSVNAKAFTQQNDYDTSVCFFIDLSLPSNQKRFFVYHLKQDSILNSALVTHGNCNQYWLEGRKYGNAVGSGCSSLGKYKVGNSYYGKFGLAFKLHGLDKTNSNAYRRYVVLHSHECVPDVEVEQDICQSNGCPTVSPSFLRQLESIIKKAERPILLWIYDEGL